MTRFPASPLLLLLLPLLSVPSSSTPPGPQPSPPSLFASVLVGSSGPALPVLTDPERVSQTDVFARVYESQVHRHDASYAAHVMPQDEEETYHSFQMVCERRRLEVSSQKRANVINADEVSFPRFATAPVSGSGSASGSGSGSGSAAAAPAAPVVPASLVEHGGVIVSAEVVFPVPITEAELALVRRMPVRVDSVNGAAPLLLGSSLVAGRSASTGHLKFTSVLDCVHSDDHPSDQQRVCESSVVGSTNVHRALVTLYSGGRKGCCGHEFNGCSCGSVPDDQPVPVAQFVVCAMARTYSLTMLKVPMHAAFGAKDVLRATRGICNLASADADADTSGVPTVAAAGNDGTSRRRLLSTTSTAVARAVGQS